jgi:hypothetical protein
MQTSVIYGRSLEDHLFDCVSAINREICSGSVQPELLIQGLGMNINKTLAISEMLEKHLAGQVVEIKKRSFKIIDMNCPVLEIKMQFETDKLLQAAEEDVQSGTGPSNFDDQNYFTYPFYEVLLTWLLETSRRKVIEVRKFDGQSVLIKIKREPDNGLKITKGDETDRNIYHGLADGLGRAGLLFPENILEVIRKLREHDDVILGIDTNILYDCNVSEHLLPLISSLNMNACFPVPNWMLFIVPSAVMHELEEAANIKNEGGYLQYEGRNAFRALQEILYLSQSAEIPGVSLLISGQANPVLDTIIDIQGLRDYMFKRDLRVHSDVVNDSLMPKKRSTGDMIIRDQFKCFLRNIDFHKGTYFLTSDKANAALAETEGLNPICIEKPYMINILTKPNKPDVEIRECQLEYIDQSTQEKGTIRLSVPLGALTYELAVARGEVRIYWEIKGEERGKYVDFSVDSRGNRLENYLERVLFINDFQKQMLMSNYKGIPLWKIEKIYNCIIKYG